MTQAPAPFTYPDAPIQTARALPVQPPTRVFGRNRVLASSHVAIKGGKSVLLYGPTGIGKSTVAAVLAAAQTATDQGKVLWLTLTEDELPLLLARVGRAYGVVTIADQPITDQITAVRDLLTRNHPLIILDGLLDADVIREFILRAASGIPLIAIDSRPSAGSWTLIQVEPLSDDARVNALRAYSNMADSNEADAFTQLAALIGGNPLALELAGRYLETTHTSADDMIVALYSTINEAMTDDDAQGIDHILSLVYPKLIPIAQGVCLVLGAVFTGGASAELLSDLTSLSADQLHQVAEILSQAGLIQVQSAYGQPQYVMHESVQSYMRGLLRAGSKLTNTEDRTLQAIEGYVARHAHPTATDHDRLAAEMPNIVYAAAYAASVDQDEPIHTLINNLTDQAGDFVSTRGFQPELAQLRQLLGLFGTQLTEPSQTAPPPVAAQTVEQAALQMPLPADSELKGTEPLVAVDPSPVPDVTPRPLVTVSPLPDNVHDAHTPQPAGRILPTESTVEPAQATPSAPSVVVAPVPRPLITVSPLPDNVHDAHTPQPAGRLYPPAPVTPAPEPVSEAAVPPPEPPAHMPEFESYLINRSTPSLAPAPVAEAPVTDSKITEPVVPVPLDTASMLAQSDRTTVEGLTACIQAARATNDHATIADCALRLGDLYMNVQDTAHAIPNYQTAIDALHSGTDQRMTALAMERLARAYLIAGRISEAAQTLESTASLLESDANPSDKSRVLSTLGSTYDTLQNWSAAQTAHERASKAAYDVSDRRQEALDLGGLAHAHQAQGHTPEAIESYRKGLHVAYSLNDSALVTNYTTQLGGILIMDGKTLNQAVSLLSEAVSRQPENIDAQRLLKRGQRWVEQAQSNNVALPPALDNPRFARLAYVASVG